MHTAQYTVWSLSSTWGFSWNAHKKPVRFLSHFHIFGKQINSLRLDSKEDEELDCNSC